MRLEPVNLVTTDTASLVVNGGTGNDSLEVWAALHHVPVTYNGGTGTNAGALPEQRRAWQPGRHQRHLHARFAGRHPGTDTLVFGAGTETVDFQNLAPIFDLVPGPLAVNGTNAANAINYTTASATWPIT